VSKSTQYNQSVESIIPTVTGYKNLLFARNSNWCSKFECDRWLWRDTNIWTPKVNKRCTGALYDRAA